MQIIHLPKRTAVVPLNFELRIDQYDAMDALRAEIFFSTVEAEFQSIADHVARTVSRRLGIDCTCSPRPAWHGAEYIREGKSWTCLTTEFEAAGRKAYTLWGSFTDGEWMFDDREDLTTAHLESDLEKITEALVGLVWREFNRQPS